jgi:hypothetical protein
MALREAVVALATLTLCGCSSSTTTAQLTLAQLRDPQSCEGCHPTEFLDWSGSMHAYSTKDPVFRAMNQRGQRETDGGLGTFCVNCHAPMAVQLGLTTDGLNLDSVPEPAQGVTCFFCHSVSGVTGAHNNPLTLATDQVLRGSFADVYTKGLPHGAGYSSLLDRESADSASMCGACHDIHAPPGGDIERTFVEWQASVFSQVKGDTCSECHMPQSVDMVPVATVSGAPLRRTHGHGFPGVDVALTDFPDKPNQLSMVQSFLHTVLQSAICVEPFGNQSRVTLLLDNVASGHSWPSGAAQDRRAWMEVHAYSGDAGTYSSGVVPVGTAVTSLADPDLWLLRDCMFDAQGDEVQMFWQAASYEGNALPVQVTFDISDPRYYQSHKYRAFPVSGASIPTPDRITFQAHITPIGLDVLDGLIASGDLDAGFRAVMPTFDVGSTLEWTTAAATNTYVNRVTGNTVYCFTTTNINVQADKFPAPVRTRCAP